MSPSSRAGRHSLVADDPDAPVAAADRPSALGRLIGRVPGLAKAPVLSLLSQVVGVAQLGLILALVGANNATDTYFYLFTLGTVPVLGLLVGVMYPSMLNERRLSRSALRRLHWITPLLAAAFVLGGCLWLGHNGRLTSGLIPLVVACGANAVCQARLWFRAVAAEAGGSAEWTAAIALPANLLAVVGLAIPWPNPEDRMTAMVVGLVLGNLGLLAYMARRSVGDAAVRAAPDRSHAPAESGWFVGLSTVGFLGQTLLQSLAVLLPAAGVTVLNVAYKIVSSVSATFVNALMPRVVHQDTESIEPAKRFLRTIVAVVGGGGLVMAVAVAVVRPDLTLAAGVVTVWLVLSSASAVASRMSFRFLRPVAAARTITVVLVVSALALASSHAPGFSLVVLLCAYAVSDGTSAAALLWALRDRVVSVALAAVVLVIGAIWVGQLV